MQAVCHSQSHSGTPAAFASAPCYGKPREHRAHRFTRVNVEQWDWVKQEWEPTEQWDVCDRCGAKGPAL